MSEYIEREKAIAFAHNAMWGKPKECEKLEEVLRMMPADDVAPVIHAKWIVKGGNPSQGTCSNCDGNGNWRNQYCPNCGAKMDAEE